MTDDSLPTPTDDLPGVTPEGPASGRRKRALWGVLAVLAVGVGAVAIRAADDPSTRVPVALGAAPESAAADMSMRAFVRYVAGPGLPALGGEGPAYRLPAGTTTSRVVELARALGLEGEPTRGQDSWHLQDGDRYLDVYEGLGTQWSYGAGLPEDARSVANESGNASSEPTCVGGPAVDCGPVDLPVTTIPAPADPEAVAAAKAQALDLLAATGMDLGDVEVTVEGPQPHYWVYVVPRLDGRLANDLGASVGIREDGGVLFANGRLGRPEGVGDVAMVDTAEAIDRLNEGVGGWQAYGEVGMAGDAAAGSCEATADGRETCTSVPPCPTKDDVAPAAPTTMVAVAPDTPVASDQPGSGGGVDAVEPVAPTLTDPVDCGYSPPAMPEEPMEVVLTDARVNLMLLPASDGSNDGYLVPGYEFDADGIPSATQAAIADDALEPVDVDPQPQPAPYLGAGTGTGTGCAQPEPGPDGAVPDICLDPGPATTVADGTSGNTSSSPGSGADPTMNIQPDVTPTTPCVLPPPGPNGEVPAIACADGPPPG